VPCLVSKLHLPCDFTQAYMYMIHRLQMSSFKCLSAMYYIIAMEDVLGSAGPALTFNTCIIASDSDSCPQCCNTRMKISYSWKMDCLLKFNIWMYPHRAPHSTYIAVINLSVFHSGWKQMDRSFKVCMY
jgi:hypothetical protein